MLPTTNHRLTVVQINLGHQVAADWVLGRIMRYKLKDTYSLIMFQNDQHSLCIDEILCYQQPISIWLLFKRTRTSLDWSCCRSQQVARQVVGSLLLRLPPAGTSGDQRDTTCATIGQFAGRSKRQHIARSKRMVPTAPHFSRLNRGDQHAHVTKDRSSQRRSV